MKKMIFAATIFWGATVATAADPAQVSSLSADDADSSMTGPYLGGARGFTISGSDCPGCGVGNKVPFKLFAGYQFDHEVAVELGFTRFGGDSGPMHKFSSEALYAVAIRTVSVTSRLSAAFKIGGALSRTHGYFDDGFMPIYYTNIKTEDYYCISLDYSLGPHFSVTGVLDATDIRSSGLFMGVGVSFKF